ncbi:MAG: replicative DNA helicase [Planctomycetota bacterium]
MAASPTVEITQEALTKLPPQAPDAEKSLLGAILLDGDVLTAVMPLVSASDFYVTAHERIYEAMVKLFQQGSRVDATLVKEQLRRHEELERVGGEDYLVELVETVPSAAGAEDYGRLVREKAIARSLIHVCTEVQTAAYEGTPPGDELLDFAENRIFGLSSVAAAMGLARMRDVLNDAFADIERLQSSGGALTGLATGFLELDDVTAGLQAGDLILVAGRPSMGKTTFANCVALNAAISGHVPVAIFSLEVGRRQIVRNLLCSRARVDATKVRRGRLDDTEWDALTRAASDLMEAPIFIDDSSQANPLQLRAKARRIKQKHGLGLLVVDYIQLLESPAAENRNQEMTQISRALKATARELDIPVIAVSQLSRAVDQREDRRPRMSDLRESGALEQDADVILFLYRREYYQPREDKHRNLADLIVAKQRNGPTRDVSLAFFGQYLRFENRTRSEEEPF